MKMITKEMKKFHIHPATAEQWISNAIKSGNVVHANGAVTTIQDGNKKLHIFQETDPGFPNGWMKVEEFSA
jgi:hypothetical protein